MPEWASKELPEVKSSRRVGSETSRSGHKPKSLRAQLLSKPIFSAQMLAALTAVIVFIAFVTNALLLQSGTRSGTILDGLDLTALPHRSAVPDLPPIRGNATPNKEGVVPIPVPRKRSDDSEVLANDQLQMLRERPNMPLTSQKTIIYMQQILNKLGYGPISENGSYSEPFRLAISRFEKDRKMIPTGEIDAALVRELGRASGTPLE